MKQRLLEFNQPGNYNQENFLRGNLDQLFIMQLSKLSIFLYIFMQNSQIVSISLFNISSQKRLQLVFFEKKYYCFGSYYLNSTTALFS